MILGKILSINSEKKLFSVKLDDDDFTIVEYYDDNDISQDDLILAGNIVGDAFIKNETKDKYFQAKIRCLGFTEKKMQKMMNG